MIVHGQNIEEILAQVKQRAGELFANTNVFGLNRIRLYVTDKGLTLTIGEVGDMEGQYAEQQVDIIGMREFDYFYYFGLSEVLKRLNETLSNTGS